MVENGDSYFEKGFHNIGLNVQFLSPSNDFRLFSVRVCGLYYISSTTYSILFQSPIRGADKSREANLNKK